MEGVTLILEISIAVLLAALVVSVIYTHFKTSIDEFKNTSSEIVDTTSKFDMVLLKQYDITTVNGYDVRYAIKQLGTSSPSKYGGILNSKPNDFFVCVQFKQVPSGGIKRKINNMEVTFIIPNKYEELNDSIIKTRGSSQYIDAFYIAPESKFKAYLLVEGKDATEQPLKNLNLQCSTEDNIESDDVLGIYFLEN